MRQCWCTMSGVDQTPPLSGLFSSSNIFGSSKFLAEKWKQIVPDFCVVDHSGGAYFVHICFPDFVVNMTERKVLNKYYPPDFDPSKLPRLRLPKNRQFNVRIMAPCNMKCNTCGEYIYKGKKFNSRQETVDGEAYLGLRIYRFYIKCPRCMSEITFKTNLEEMDYELEHGATRNFQAVRLAEQQAEKQEEARVEEEKSNPMIALERRTQDSRHEMDRLEALEELKDLNTRQANVNYDDVIRMTVEKEMQALREQEEADEAFVRSIFSKDEGTIMKRLRDSDSSEEEDLQRSYVPITNATDILASSSLANDLKKPKIVTELVPWQKSVGSLSRGNGSLASFVRPKQWKITMPFTSPADPCDLGGSTSAVAVGKSSGLSSLANQYGTDSDDND